MRTISNSCICTNLALSRIGKYRPDNPLQNSGFNQVCPSLPLSNRAVRSPKQWAFCHTRFVKSRRHQCLQRDAAHPLCFSGFVIVITGLLLWVKSQQRLVGMSVIAHAVILIHVLQVIERRAFSCTYVRNQAMAPKVHSPLVKEDEPSWPCHRALCFAKPGKP